MASDSPLNSKEHSFKNAADRYIPPCISLRYADPLLSLTHYFETAITIAAAAEQIETLQKAVSQNKKNSIKRGAAIFVPSTATATNSTNTPNKTVQQTARLGECAEQISKKLSAAIDAFTRLVVRVTRLKDNQQILDLITVASYYLVDQSIATHPELKCLKLCDNSMVIAVGLHETEKQILKDCIADGCDMKRATERCSAVVQQASRWLTAAFENDPAGAAAVLPVFWMWNNDTLELLTESQLEAINQQCKRELPFLVIGILDLLQLHAERDNLILELYQLII